MQFKATLAKLKKKGALGLLWQRGGCGGGGSDGGTAAAERLS